MTRYEELAAAAVKSITEFYNDKAEREEDARFVLAAIVEYLQAPNGTVLFAELGPDLHSTGNTDPYEPALRWAADAAWHFGVRIRFSNDSSNAYGKLTIKLKLQRRKEGFRLHFERDYDASRNSKASLDGFLQDLCRGIAEDYAKPLGAVRPRIGF